MSKDFTTNWCSDIMVWASVTKDSGTLSLHVWNTYYPKYYSLEVVNPLRDIYGFFDSSRCAALSLTADLETLGPLLDPGL